MAVKRGFTYVDVVLVILVLAIMTAAAYPSWQSFSAKLQLRNAARRLASDLRWARAHAIRTGSQVAVVFDPKGDSYQFPGLDDPRHPGRSYVVTLAHTAPGVDLVRVSFPRNAFTWNAVGLPSDAGQVVLRRGPWQTVVAINAAGTVSTEAIGLASATATP